MSVTLRRFRNGDPPALARLWNAAGLGRGAVAGLTVDVLDHLVLAQQHFGPDAVTLAVEEDGLIGRADAPRTGGGGTAVGFVLHGLAPPVPAPGLPGEPGRVGVIDAVVVHPDARGRGIGRRLVDAAVASLRDRGAGRVALGGGPAESPFLVGLYGGCGPAGLLESDPAAAPFAAACGFAPAGRTAVLQRPTDLRDRAGFQVLAARRHTTLRTAPATRPDRWWGTRYGRLDTLRFELVPSHRGVGVRTGPGPGGGAGPEETPAAAGVTLVGLDLYGPTWNRRAVGLRDLVTGPGGGPPHLHALILETTRRLREEAVDLLEVHVDANDGPTLALLARIGFAPVDHGVRYERAV